MIKLIMIIKETLNNFFNNKKLQKKNNIDNKVNNIENKVNKIQHSIIHLENIMQEVYYKKIFSNDENYPLRIIQKKIC
jgi:peptidoglycan hydrolase CwlO-like protein